AGALRPKLECPHLVDPGDASAACTHLDDVDDWKSHRVATGISADVIALRDRDHAFLDQAGLRGRAAHVKRDEIADAGPPADLGRGDDAAYRPGFHHGDGKLLRLLRRHDPPARLHDQEPALDPVLAEPLAHAANIVARLRSDIGV